MRSYSGQVVPFFHFRRLGQVHINDSTLLQSTTQGWALKNFGAWQVGHETFVSFKAGHPIFTGIFIFPKAHLSRYLMACPHRNRLWNFTSTCKDLEPMLQ